MTELPRLPAERPLHAVLVRRVRESPWTLCSVALITASLAATIVHRAQPDDFRALFSYGLWSWAGVVAGITAGAIGRRHHVAPPAPGDTPDPIRAAWFLGSPGDLRGPADAEIHDLGDAVRLTRFSRSAPDLALLGAGVLVPTVLGGGLIGALAFPCLGWALGMPRRGRVWADVPWSSVRSWATTGGTQFTLRCDVPGLARELGLIARFTQRERLTALLSDRVGPPAHGTPTPEEWAADLAAEGEDGEMDWGTLWRRMRRGGALLFGVALLVAGILVHTAGFVLSSPGSRLAGSVVAGVGGLIAVFGASALGNRWRGARPALDDSADPLHVRWTNRPGWPGPREAFAHVQNGRLRVVGHELNPWDCLVIAAAVVVAYSVAGIFGMIGVTAVSGALGFPRRMRVVADVPWDDLRAEVRGTDFEIRSPCRPPADCVRLEAKYSHRERLTAALVQRAGARTHIATRVPPGKQVPAREPTAAEIAARTAAVRKLGERS